MLASTCTWNFLPTRVVRALAGGLSHREGDCSPGGDYCQRFLYLWPLLALAQSKDAGISVFHLECESTAFAAKHFRRLWMYQSSFPFFRKAVELGCPRWRARDSVFVTEFNVCTILSQHQHPRWQVSLQISGSFPGFGNSLQNFKSLGHYVRLCSALKVL